MVPSGGIGEVGLGEKGEGSSKGKNKKINNKWALCGLLGEMSVIRKANSRLMCTFLGKKNKEHFHIPHTQKNKKDLEFHIFCKRS